MERLKEVDFGKRFARSQFSFIYKSKKNRRRAFNTIKNSLDFSELCQASDFIERNINEKFRQLLFGNALPNSYKDLGKCDYHYSPKSLIAEINWILLGIRKFSYQINLFLVYKRIYDNYLLTGEYELAEKYLTKIEEEICYSLWTLENRFLLKEITQSSIDNKEFLGKFNLENESEGCTKSLAHYLSIRAERTLSVNRFHADLNSALEKIDGDRKEEHIDYYLFKLSFLNTSKYKKYTEILAYDFNHSIVDKYLSLRKMLSSMLTTANEMIDKVEDGQVIKEYIVNRINYLIRKIDDPILFKLKLFANEKMFPAFDETDSKKQILIIDKYTAGLYMEVEEDLKGILIEEAGQFDLYDLYVRSLIYQKKKFQHVGNPKSLQNQILQEMYRTISASSDPSESGMNLLRIANNISSNTLSYGIIDFVLYQTKGMSERKLLSRLSFNPANPVISEIYTEESSQINYLELLKGKFPDSLTINFFLSKLRNFDELKDFESKLPQGKYKSEYAKGLQKRKQFKEASEIWEFLKDNYTDTAPILEMAIRNLFTCYFSLQEYDKCVKLFTDSFFINPYIIEKIELDQLLQRIKESRFKAVKASIDLPIFYTIANADENETHTAFEKFNLSCGVCKPSELIPKFNRFEKEKIVFYLKFTCGQEILKHSIHIVGSKDRLEERLSICQFLKEIDIEDKTFYEDEIKNISNILVIQKGLLELDESKIYVNEQGIVSKELREFEAVFQRFKTIAGVTERNKILFLDTHQGTLTTVNYSNDDVEAERIEYSSNPVFDIYKELFDAIKHKFLYSKFGIVAYLSTRIRHGVLLGEIRPIFEKYKLITIREGDSTEYRRNVYWDTVFSYETTFAQAKIQEILKEFSYSVDGLIFDLIKKYLQVYDEKISPDGWFNYDFEDDDLFWYSIASIHSKEFNQFAQGVFEILWSRTDLNLSLIRLKIQNEVSSQFNALFDKLEKDISDMVSTIKSQQLVDAIKSCSTETQAVLIRISSWFKRSGTSSSDFVIDNLVDIVMEYTNKTHPNKKIILERDITFNCKIRGEYLTHFADLLRIFLENILKHSEETSSLIRAKISIANHNDEMEIIIKNTVTNKQSIETLKNIWIDNKMDTSKLVDEGKSGFHKANKILKSDLLNENNHFCTSITEDEDMFSVIMNVNVSKLLA